MHYLPSVEKPPVKLRPLVESEMRDLSGAAE